MMVVAAEGADWLNGYSILANGQAHREDINISPPSMQPPFSAHGGKIWANQELNRMKTTKRTMKQNTHQRNPFSLSIGAWRAAGPRLPANAQIGSHLHRHPCVSITASSLPIAPVARARETGWNGVRDSILHEKLTDLLPSPTCSCRFQVS